MIMNSSFSVSIIYRTQKQKCEKDGINSLKKSYLIELDDVRVANFLQNFDLSGDSLNILLVIDLFFFQNFHGNLS